MNQSKESRVQFIRIDRGISQFNNDYYAALGLPIISSPIYIRHVYVSIARILHPDIYGFSAEEKEIATQYLAKLVNPAYNILMKEEERKAYQGIFKLLAKRLMQKSRNVQIFSPSACELMLAPSDGAYERAVSAIAKKQYESIKTILEYTAQISELNLVYILYKEGYQYGAPDMPPVLLPKSPIKSKFTPPIYPTSSVKTTSNYPSATNYQTAKNRQDDTDATVFQTKIESVNTSNSSDRLKVCEIYMSQGDWKAAFKELRELLQVETNNSKGHAMLGVVYKNINQPQMAKASLMRSLQLNPQEPLALKHIQDLSNPTQPNPTSKTQNKQANNRNPPAPIVEPQKRGWLSNLLGWADPDNQKK
ncbi:DnaJ domain-containing protein [Pseudanabaena biceps]|nr:DnaJ domain-containing protein [Pseudanabaena biceps]